MCTELWNNHDDKYFASKAKLNNSTYVVYTVDNL